MNIATPLFVALLLPTSSLAAVYYDDTNGDGSLEEIHTLDQFVRIKYQNGTFSDYHMGLPAYSFFKIADTDGQPGSEIILKQDTYLVVISDASRRQVGYSVGASGTPYATGQTDGLSGDEIIGFDDQGLFVIADAQARTSRYHLQPDRAIPSPYSTISFAHVADTDGTMGEEVILSRSDNRVVVVNDSRGTVAVHDMSAAPNHITTMQIYATTDTDGVAGGEVVVWRNDNTVVVIHEANGGLKKYYSLPGLFQFAGLANTDTEPGAEIIITQNNFVISMISDRVGQLRPYNIGQPFAIEDIGRYDNAIGADVCYRTNQSNPVNRYAVSDTDRRIVYVSACQSNNEPPRVIAESNRIVTSGATVVLDASQSSDPDGRVVKYNWKQTAGPTVVLKGVTAPVLSFVAPRVAQTTTLTFDITAQDDDSAASSSSVSVVVMGTSGVPGAPNGALPWLVPMLLELLMNE